MNSSEQQYQTFIASVCTQFECKAAIAPLQEGFSALCEAIEGESAWNDVERIHVFHEADPSLDLDINLNSLWKVRQKNSVTKDDVVRTFIEDAVDLNKWMTSSKDGRAVITSATIKFKDDPEEIRVDIPVAPVCESSDNEDYDGRDSFTRCRNCGAEVYDDDLDDQGYCPDCHDVCYTDTRIPTKWDRM